MSRFEINSRAKRIHRLLSLLTGRAPLGPQIVSLEVTHHCNLRCTFCESHGSLQLAPITMRRVYEGGRRQMDLDTIRRLMEDLTRLGTDLVELSGKGDPIAHRELTTIIGIIKDAGLGCSLVTNGTLAQPDLAPTLVERGLDRLSVSLNAGSREVYRRVTGRDLWEKAIAFLEEVLEHRRNAAATRPWVRITHVLTRENVGDLERMVHLACDLRVDEVLFARMGELPETVHLQLDAGDVAGIRQQTPEWSRHLEEAGIVHDLGRFSSEASGRPAGSRRRENHLQRLLPCYDGWMFCVIGPDGAVVPCCYCEERVLGNIHAEPFRNVWSGVAYRDLRLRMRAMPRTGRPICPECFTNCNRAVENQRIYNRIHPLRKVRAPGSGPASEAIPSET